MTQPPWFTPSSPEPFDFDAESPGAPRPGRATPPAGEGWASPPPSAPPWRADDPTLHGAGAPPLGPPPAPIAAATGSPGGPLLPPPVPAPHPPTPPRGSGTGWRVACAALAATTLFAGGFAVRGVVGDDLTTPTTDAASDASTVPVDLATGEPAAEVSRVLGPAVVQIDRADGLGSGVIYDASGLILTNAHVVGESRAVEVRLADGTVLDGRVLGADVARDLAVVSVTTDLDLPVADLALDVEPVVGQMAIAVGSPFGLTQSVTSGIVSAVDRPVDGQTDVLIGMVQTDAPINPGNSGGALADRAGRVIGINSSIYSESGENNGIGFAIPIDIAIETARRIVEGESLDIARVGVQSDPEGTDDGSPGALVARVTRGGPADDAGIEAGDVIVSVEDRPVIDYGDLAVKVSRHFPGDTITLEVERDGKARSIDLTLGTD